MRPSDYRRISLAAIKLKNKILHSEEQRNNDTILEKQDRRINQQSEELIRSKKSKDISLSQKQSDVKKFDSMSYKSQKSTYSTNAINEICEPPMEPAKKDLFDYLNKLTASVEWFVSIFGIYFQF